MNRERRKPMLFFALVATAVAISSVTGQPPEPVRAAPGQSLVLATAKEGIERVEGVQFTDDGSALLVDGYRKATYPGQQPVLTLWGLPAGRVIRRVHAGYGSLSADGRVLAGGDRDSVKVWDVPTGEIRHSFERSSSPKLSPDGRYLVTDVYGDGPRADGIQVLDLGSGKRLFYAAIDNELWTGCRAFLSGNRFAFDTLRFKGKGVGRLTVADLSTGVHRQTMSYRVDSFGNGNAGPGDTWAAIHPDGRPRLYDAITGKLIRRFGPAGSSKNWLCDVDLSQDGRSLVGPVRPGVVAVWDVKTGAERATFEVAGDFFSVPRVRFTPDSRYVVIRWESGFANLYESRYRPHAAVYAVDGRLVWQGRGVAAVEFDRPMKSAALVTNTRGGYTQDDPPNVVEIHDAAAWLAGGSR